MKLRPVTGPPPSLFPNFCGPASVGLMAHASASAAAISRRRHGAGSLLVSVLLCCLQPGRATSLASALVSLFGSDGSQQACGYNTSSCTCGSFFMSGSGYTGTLPSQIGDCTNIFMM